MKTLNKIILTGLSLLSLNNLYGQNANLDSLLEQNNLQRESRDSLRNVQSRDINNLLNQMKISSPEYFSKKIYSENLCINLDEKIYHVTKKNEEEGLKDLIKICNGNYEEAWLYLPEKQIWYETGINSDLEHVENYTLRIEKALEENKDVKELIFYHNHPSGISEPSLGDMRTLFYFNLDLPDYKIVGKVITKEGIAEYSLNSKGKEKLKDPDFGRYIEDFTPEYFDIKCTSIDGLLKK